MKCEILRTLYMKANGEIVCNDDNGEQISLGMPKFDRPRIGLFKILQNDKYAHIRAAFAAGQVPWPGVCENCALLRMHEPAGADLLAEKVIDKFQVEGSLACGLKCPSCCNGAQIRARQGPVHLPPEWYRKVLSELAEAGFRVGWVEFCGQGEPLNHPEFAQLVEITREVMPDTRVRLITNGNHSFMRKIGSVFVDETIVSVDGARQSSYAQYRRGGNVSKALAFLEASCDTQIPRGGRVIWKYILFHCNDSDEELRAAQELAADMGVTRLWFVHGHGEMVSRRFTFENAMSPPVIKPNVKVESHPSYNNRSVSLNEVGLARHLDGAQADLWLDRVVLHGNDTMTLSGWVNSREAPFAGLRVSVDGAEGIDMPVEIDRPDVMAADPNYGSERCGFDVLIRAPGLKEARQATLSFALQFADRATARLRRDVLFPRTALAS